MSRTPFPLQRWLVLALLCVPSVARAHIGFRSSEPATGSTVSQVPRRILLRFSGRPEPALSRIRLTGPRGDVGLDAIVADSTNGLAATLEAPLVAGQYTVTWRAASADGHVVSGEFTFTFAPPVVAGASPAPAALPETAAHAAHTASPEAHERHTQYQWARWFDFVATIVAIGALAFRVVVLPALAARGVPTADAAGRARIIAIVALLVCVVAALYRGYAESVAVHGADHAMDAALVSAMLLETTWGAGWMLGIGGAVAALSGWLLTSRGAILSAPLALAGTLAIAVAPALTGHAVSGAWPPLGVTADALHVLAAGAWTGGLFLLLTAGVPSMTRSGRDVHASIRALVQSYHPMALFCGPLVIATGIVSGWLRLGGLEPLWQSGYGVTLLWKLALFAGVAGSGLHNAVRTRRMLGSEAGTRRLRRAATIELVFVVLVIAVTTLLVVTPSPAEAPAP